MGAEAFFREKLVANLGRTPTSCQQRLFETLSRFTVQYDECDILVVSGYAGTGKTSAIASFVRTLKELQHKFVLMAPTGRAAKVLSGFTGEKAYTIHRHIYRQKSVKDGIGEFRLNFNKSKETFFIVDEASLITAGGTPSGAVFGSGDLLDDLVSFVRGGVDDKLIIIGDRGQLPPIGLEESPALSISYMERYGAIMSAELTTVVRQAAESGILTNATTVRNIIERGVPEVPKLTLEGFTDVERIDGADLIEKLDDAIRKWGIDDIAVLCRSNRRANRYNEGIISRVLNREDKLVRGDRLMVVKNCYQFLDNVPELDFIANGDVVKLLRIHGNESLYGLHFADAVLSFPDYNDVEIAAKVILDTLDSEQASLSREQQNALYAGVSEGYKDERNARERYRKIRGDKYYNALQIKYATAITCHKSQGGQWDCVFIDNPFWQELTIDDLKWLYTAMTRGIQKIYLVNFDDKFFRQ